MVRERGILFAGGGTGGHLYPGIALAQSLSGRRLFLCTERPFDRSALDAARLPYRVLPSPRLSPSFPVRFGRAVAESLRALREFRPDVLVGLGGYGSVPPVAAAMLLGIPYVLLEQNIRPGKANRALAPMAARVYAQWRETRLPGRVVAAGSPIRPGLRRIPKSQACARLGLDPDRPTVLVLGGSQGAGALNALDLDVQTIRITGRGRTARGTVVLEYLDEMELAYSAADLAVSRAGALAIAELACFGLPTVLVPYPHAADDHQRANARALGDAVWVVEESEIGRIAEIVAKLVSADPEVHNRGRALQRFARPEAARTIAEDLSSI
ncbi:MAG: UDP-N-acetylglucosamine--N-acetylmuramyl-(pentapeptide) pyrophosphoryl-undecaprenol N-acetylglucosamine transferase [Planctomycetes bacterium]|nr:UDP-N-acetylglucosamine--N-acetylmuramyl-(pentapeptide) pyrophosphoryl-undecaprenol N-acetylglucosamine transferase [Planctomycetota bacterium]